MFVPPGVSKVGIRSSFKGVDNTWDARLCYTSTPHGTVYCNGGVMEMQTVFKECRNTEVLTRFYCSKHYTDVACCHHSALVVHR